MDNKEIRDYLQEACDQVALGNMDKAKELIIDILNATEEAEDE